MKRCFYKLSGKLLAAAAFSVALTAGQAQAALLDGLVNYWTFDEGSFEDFAPEGESFDELIISCDPADLNNFDCVGTTLDFSDDLGLFGTALDLSGDQADGHLFAEQSPDTVGVAGEGGFLDGNMAISVWARADEFTHSWQAIMAHGEGGGYRLHRNGGNSWGAFTGNSAGDTDPLGPTVDIGPGTGWHHFVATVSDNVSSLYVDGVLESTENEDGASAPELRGTNGVHIGFNPDTAGREWNGQIDDAAMWNRPLSAGEVTEIYNKGLNGFALTEEDDGGSFIPPNVAGPAGADGRWGVREYRGNGVIDAGRRATEVASDASGTVVEGTLGVLDVADNGVGGSALTDTPSGFLGGSNDDIVTVAKGRMNIVEGGDYTFRVEADNGFAMRIVGKDFDSASGGGIIDPNDSTTFARLQSGAGLGVVNLEAGEYDVEFLSWEGSGDGFYEVTSAQGVIVDEALGQWIAVGDGSTTKEAFTSLPVVRLSEDVNVFNMPGVDVNDGVNLAREEFNQGNFTEFGTSPIVAFHDPQSGNNLSGESSPFPADTDADDNDFTTAYTGSLVVDDGDEIPNEEIRLTFAMESDDNGQFLVQGSSFDTIGANSNANVELIPVNGDMACTGDFNTGNTNAICQITLVEGVHEFEGFHREQGGGAYHHIFWAEGEFDSKTSDFSILRVEEESLHPANSGIALVGGGGGVECDFDGNGTCDISDINDLSAVITAGSNDASFDMTGDGVVDQADRDAWHVATDTLPGDANLDGVVNAPDLNALGGNWQQDVDSWASGDFNGDGAANASDLNIVGGNWQRTSADWQATLGGAAAASAAAVPEPAGMTTILVSLLGLALVRRKK